MSELTKTEMTRVDELLELLTKKDSELSNEAAETIEELVAIVDELEYEKESLQEKVNELEGYIEDWNVQDTTWKDHWYNR